MNKSVYYLTTSLLALSACSLAPQFITPDVSTPPAFKEAQAETPADGILWKEAIPQGKQTRGAWWSIFDDSTLNTLETQAALSNQSLKAIEARVTQARAIANAAKSGLLPSVDLGANAVRSRSEAITPTSNFSLGGVASYEVDLFGRVRNTYQAATQDANAQAALYQSALLALQADVAQHFFSLRTFDSEIALLQDTVSVREEASRIMQKRFDEGAVAEPDTLRTQSELASVQADLIALQRQRAVSEHALAILLGKAPADFSLPNMPLETALPPQIPAGIPSALILRRPDITAALESIRAATSRVGVARAAFYPSLTLSAAGGFSASSISDIFKWSSRSWVLGNTLGNALNLPIFNGGLNKSRLQAAEAAVDEAIANYRQQVLISFREVEDNLVGQQLLAEQSVKQDIAAQAASRTRDLSQKRYDEGEADYFEVVDAQRVSLAAERGATQLRGQRFLTTISLVRALGGGWE